MKFRLYSFLKVASHMFVFSTHPTTNLYPLANHNATQRDGQRIDNLYLNLYIYEGGINICQARGTDRTPVQTIQAWHGCCHPVRRYLPQNWWHWGVTDASCSLCCICVFFNCEQDQRCKLQQCSEVQWAEIIKAFQVKHMRHMQNDRIVAIQGNIK